MNQLEELWEKIDGYEHYMVSNYGEIINGLTDREMAMSPTQGGMKVTLSRFGRTRKFLVHRLVAQAFLPDWNPDWIVKHRNGVKTDNCVLNLYMEIRSVPGPKRARAVPLFRFSSIPGHTCLIGEINSCFEGVNDVQAYV